MQWCMNPSQFKFDNELQQFHRIDCETFKTEYKNYYCVIDASKFEIANKNQKQNCCDISYIEDFQRGQRENELMEEKRREFINIENI